MLSLRYFFNFTQTFHRKEQTTFHTTKPNDFSTELEIADTQNTREIQNEDEAILINEEGVQTYLSNSAEAQEFLVLNQETGQYQKYLYIPPTEESENQENFNTNALSRPEVIVQEKSDQVKQNITEANDSDDNAHDRNELYHENKKKHNPSIDKQSKKSEVKTRNILFRCPECTKSFHSPDLLKLHYNHMHGDEIDEKLIETSSESQKLTNNHMKTTNTTEVVG